MPELDPQSLSDVDLTPRYNVAPTQPVVCVRQLAGQSVPRIDLLRWGLVPSWADDLSIGNRMINARGETVDSKPSFRRAFSARRCLIPTDGYFEWKKVSDGKQPYLIHSAEGSVFAMAGLWEENRKATGDGSVTQTCTIITTNANQLTSAIHDRMPVVLTPEDYRTWLDPDNHDAAQLNSLLKPATEEWMRLTPVSRRVNSPRNDDPECVAPLSL